MSSAKPPTGSRQVPVTNWSRRILFSLSISFTTCRNTQTHDHPCTPQHMDFIIADCVFRSSFVLSEPKCPYLPEPVNLLAVLGVMSVDGVLLPVSQIDLLHPTQHQLQHTHKHLKASQWRCVSFIDSSAGRGQNGTGQREHSESENVPSGLQTNLIHCLC